MRMSRRMGIHNAGKSGPKIETLADVFINATAGKYTSRINSKGTLRLNLTDDITNEPRYVVFSDGVADWGFCKLVERTVTHLFGEEGNGDPHFSTTNFPDSITISNCYTGFMGVFSLPKGFDEVFVDSLFSSITQVDRIGAASSSVTFSFGEDVWDTAGYAMAQAAGGLKIYSTADYLTPLLVINEDSVCCIEKIGTLYKMRVNGNQNTGAYKGYGSFTLFNG